MTEPIRIAVTGAAGRISYSLLFRIAAGSMFGPDQPVALSLLDVPEMAPLLDATMMELEDGAFPLLRLGPRLDRRGRGVRRRRLGLPARQRPVPPGDEPGGRGAGERADLRGAGAGDQRGGQERAGARRGQPVQHELPDRARRPPATSPPTTGSR